MIDGRRSIVAVATALALMASQAGSASASEDGDVAAERVTRAHAAAATEYWSPRRVERARPAAVGLSARRAAPARPAAARAAVDASAASATYPGSVHGKVFFSIVGGSDPGDYVCSGTVVRSAQHTLVWTAGHCVNDSQFGGGFATNWIFVPGYRDGARPYGTWPAAKLFTTERWADDGDLRNDLGAARLARDAQGRGIEDAIGARAIEFGLARDQAYQAFGYPASPGLLAPAFDGERLYSCASAATGVDNPPGNGPETTQIECDMTGGSSGGSWVNPAGAVNGVTSYGYPTDPLHLYGPYFGATARELYERASGPPLRCGGAAITNLGGAGAQAYTGTAGADSFKLGGGPDQASGLAGRDRACGGGGSDQLAGEDGNDVLRGGPGRDALTGGPGRDLCVGGPGRDRASGCERLRSVP